MSNVRLILAGAAAGNGNRGIEALCQSVVDSVGRRASEITMSILDDGWGVRRVADARYGQLHLERVGVRQSRRWHRPESWAQIHLAQTWRPRANPVAQRFAAADAVLDLSGGDSFTDLYGAARLDKVCAPKQAALRAGRPLVLLPQTYGPFRTDTGRARAEKLIRSAVVAYARDAWSYERLVELAGPGADPTRLRQGVDVAFALEPRRPAAPIAERVEALTEGLTAGVNASGLLRDAAGREQFGLAGNYLDTMTEVVRGLIARGARVVFVPHVHVPGGRGESDVAAISQIHDGLTDLERNRTVVLPAELDAAELKWCIAQLDWFVGSRMHSTVAALSTLTPATAYAYSDKTLGVFQTCAAGDHVVDARRLAGGEAAGAMLADFDRRGAIGTLLAAHAPAVIATSRRQLAEVLDTIAQWQGRTAPVETLA